VHGSVIDQELWDMVPRRGDARTGEEIPLAENLGRQFLYARYNAELTARWLNARGLSEIEPAKVAKMDSVEYIHDLVRVGQALADDLRIEHFALDRFGQFY
jgi:hypothetical protein